MRRLRQDLQARCLSDAGYLPDGGNLYRSMGPIAGDRVIGQIEVFYWVESAGILTFVPYLMAAPVGDAAGMRSARSVLTSSMNVVEEKTAVLLTLPAAGENMVRIPVGLIVATGSNYFGYRMNWTGVANACRWLVTVDVFERQVVEVAE